MAEAETVVETVDVEKQEAADAAAEQAAASAAFNQIHAPEKNTEPDVVKAPVVVEKSAEELAAEQKTADEAAVKKAEEDWLRGAPATVRERLERIPKLEATANQVGALARNLKVTQDKLDAQIAAQAAKAATAQGKEAPTGSQIAAATTSEKWNKLKEDFPEWVEAMEERLAVVSPAAPVVDEVAMARRVAEDVTPTVQEMTARARQLARVDMAHEDWEDMIKTPEFVTWLKAQPEDVLKLADSIKAKDTIKVLDAYVASKTTAPPSPPPQQTTSRLAAAAVPTRGSAAPVRAEETEEEAARKAFARRSAGR